jgi:serine acetyltransferase
MLKKIRKVLYHLCHGEFKELYQKVSYLRDYNRIYERSVLRASNLYEKGGIFRVVALLYHKRNRKKFPCEIYPHVKIEGKIFIPHSIGIIVGKTAVIGKGTLIFPNVVIGAAYSPYRKNEIGRRHAIIGKNCIIGANSTILGAITIGDNVIIGAGSIVTRDVPGNCIVTGVNKIRKIDRTETVSDFV